MNKWLLQRLAKVNLWLFVNCNTLALLKNGTLRLSYQQGVLLQRDGGGGCKLTLQVVTGLCATDGADGADAGHQPVPGGHGAAAAGARRQLQPAGL